MPYSIRHLAPLLLVAFAMAGCRGPKNFANDNDVLRARLLELEGQVTDLERARSELAAQLAAGSNAGPPGDRPSNLPADGALSPEVIANTPWVTAIRIARISHIRTGDDGRSVLVLYVQPEDGLGRFVQMVGRLSVTAAVLPAAGDAITIGRIELGPAALRAVYRSGLTGTHYTIEMPIELPEELRDRDAASVVVDVRATFADGRTGLEHSRHRAIEWKSDDGGSRARGRSAE